MYRISVLPTGIFAVKFTWAELEDLKALVDNGDTIIIVEELDELDRVPNLGFSSKDVQVLGNDDDNEDDDDWDEEE